MKLLDTTERIKLILEATSDKLEKIDDILLNKQKIVAENTHDNDVRTCTQQEAARRLGVSYSTAHRMMQDGRLKSVVVNKNPRILLSSVLEFALSA